MGRGAGEKKKRANTRRRSTRSTHLEERKREGPADSPLVCRCEATPNFAEKHHTKKKRNCGGTSGEESPTKQGQRTAGRRCCLLPVCTSMHDSIYALYTIPHSLLPSPSPLPPSLFFSAPQVPFFLRASWRGCRSAPDEADYKVHQNYLVIACDSHLPSPPPTCATATGTGVASVLLQTLPLKPRSDNNDGGVEAAGGIDAAVRGTR